MRVTIDNLIFFPFHKLPRVQRFMLSVCEEHDVLVVK